MTYKGDAACQATKSIDEEGDFDEAIRLTNYIKDKAIVEPYPQEIEFIFKTINKYRNFKERRVFKTIGMGLYIRFIFKNSFLRGNGYFSKIG